MDRHSSFPFRAIALALPLAFSGPLLAQSHDHMEDMAGMDMSDTATPMQGALGPYAMSREASGTSWQPEAAPASGIMLPAGDWMVMAHGLVNAIYDNQGGPRGADKTFSSSMGMLMANRPLDEDGMLGLRAMLSLDPLMGANGYPLLFATGETANGREPLVDRLHIAQHQGIADAVRLLAAAGRSRLLYVQGEGAASDQDRLLALQQAMK